MSQQVTLPHASHSSSSSSAVEPSRNISSAPSSSASRKKLPATITVAVSKRPITPAVAPLPSSLSGVYQAVSSPYDIPASTSSSRQPMKQDIRVRSWSTQSAEGKHLLNNSFSSHHSIVAAAASSSSSFAGQSSSSSSISSPHTTTSTSSRSAMMRYRKLLSESQKEVHERPPRDIYIRTKDIENLLTATTSIERAHRRKNQTIEEILLSSTASNVTVTMIADSDERVFYKSHQQERSKPNNVMLNNIVFNTLYEDTLTGQQQALQAKKRNTEPNPFRTKQLQFIAESKECPKKYKEILFNRYRHNTAAAPIIDEDSLDGSNLYQPSPPPHPPPPSEYQSPLHKNYASGQPFFRTSSLKQSRGHSLEPSSDKQPLQPQRRPSSRSISREEKLHLYNSLQDNQRILHPKKSYRDSPAFAKQVNVNFYEKLQHKSSHAYRQRFPKLSINHYAVINNHPNRMQLSPEKID